MAIGINYPVNSGNQSQLQQAPWSGLGPQFVHTISTGVCSNTAIGSGGAGGVGTYQWVQSGMPYPSGTITTIYFTDANGKDWALDVDPIYAQTMLQISQAHQMKPQQYAYVNIPATQVYSGPKPVTVKPDASMIEGDFTEGEMELAENLIAELEGGEKGSRQNIQADIDCEA